MLQLVPDGELVNRIIAFADRLELTDALRFWVAAAAAGWTGSNVETFLRECLNSSRMDLVQAATDSLADVYGSYRPL